MSNIADSVASVNQVFTNAVSALQEQILTFHRETAAAFAKATGATSQQTTNVDLSDVDSLVTQAYELQVARLEADKQFALDLIGAWTPQPAARPARTAK